MPHPQPAWKHLDAPCGQTTYPPNHSNRLTSPGLDPPSHPAPKPFARHPLPIALDLSSPEPFLLSSRPERAREPWEVTRTRVE